MSADGPKRIVLAAGGTGGHMFPAEALAQELAARGHQLILITDRRGARLSGEFRGIETHHIHASGLAGGRGLGRLRGVAELALGLLEAERILHRLNPDAAIGFGGYPSLPTMLAAVRRGIPTVIHEQNAILGRANRLLAPRVTRIATSFDDVRGIKASAAAKVRLTGNPVRAPIAALSHRPYPALPVDGSRRLVVLGGSQGASVFGRVVPEAIARLPETLRCKLSIRQQCRPEDLSAVAATYARLGVKACLAAFFDDVPALLSGAHLVVSRAGASTIAELTAAGRPSILVPYPYATEDHQTANARILDRSGAAWPIAEPDFTPDRLAGLLVDILTHPVMLGTAAMCARAAGTPSAARGLADLAAAILPSNGNRGGLAGSTRAQRTVA
jgi:UDP-N-acetylglucosamine--N-acetylmuramyl-(pentapeptide) pyrophosphoryl-undecaprenol N-acetylglucosamine transferase